MTSIEVLNSILTFAIDGLVQLFHDLRARRFRSLEMSINILDKHRQALRPEAELRRAPASCSRPINHDPRVAQM